VVSVVDAAVKVDVLLVEEDAVERRVVPVDSVARVVVKVLQLVLQAAVVADQPKRAAKAVVAAVAELRTQQEAQVAKLAVNREVSVVLEMPADQLAGARER
jgi:hypothetical protein